jgi:metallophosphoesterase superfamily enzyme
MVFFVIEIEKKIWLTGYGLYLEEPQILAIGDLHLGLEEELNNRGVMIPRTNFIIVKKELYRIFTQLSEKKFEIQKIILMGDIKHEFGRINRQEINEVKELIQLLEKKCKQIILIKGNHDKILPEYFVGEKTIITENYFEKINEKENKNKEINNKETKNKKTNSNEANSKTNCKETNSKNTLSKKINSNNITLLFTHGDKNNLSELEKNGKPLKKLKIIIGHEHPAIVIYDEHKNERYKCLAKFNFENKIDVFVLPSFNFMKIGTDLSSERLLSPFLKNAKSFECWAIEEGEGFYLGNIKRTNRQMFE